MINIKKIVAFATASLTLTLLTSPVSAADKKGDVCFTTTYKTDAVFKCSYLFDRQPVTVKEIYERGYKVVISQIPNASSNYNWFIVVESQ